MAKRRLSQSRKNRLARAKRAARKSRTHVFDVTGLPVHELRKTPLGRRIIELSNRNLPEDIAFVQDDLSRLFEEKYF